MKQNENLEKCVRDLEKIIEAEKLMSGLEQMKNEDTNINRYLEYILDKKIVKDLEDVFYIIAKIPSISKQFTKVIENSKTKESLVKLEKKASNNSNSNSNYKYTRVYNSLNEVPGYMTKWNERCIPDGVHICASNCRC